MDSELCRFLREVTKSKINSWPTVHVRSFLHKIGTEIIAWRNCSPELEFLNKCQITVFWNPGIWGDGEIIDVLYNILKLGWDFQGSLVVGFVVNLANLYFPDPGSILSNTTITQFQLLKFFYNASVNSISGRSWAKKLAWKYNPWISAPTKCWWIPTLDANQRQNPSSGCAVVNEIVLTSLWLLLRVTNCSGLYFV